MPGRAPYPPYTYSGGQWHQQLPPMFPYPAYAQYPWYPSYTGGHPAGNPYGYGYASPRQQGRRRSLSPPEDVELHQLLGGQHRGTAYWDITQVPESARQITSRGGLDVIPSAMLSAPATNPPTHYMKIVCDAHPFDITLDIPRGNAISVEMVFGAIYGTLQEPLSRDDWDEQTKSGKKRIHKSRCIRLGKVPPTFKMDGHALKVDYLTDKTFFVSLKPEGPPDRPDHWLLVLGALPQRH